MSLTKLALKAAAPIPKLETFNSFLFVGPHPDDIEIGAGATAAKLVSMGKHVTFLICTDGRYGTDYTDMNPDVLAEKRKQEAIQSAAVLGVKDVRFMNLSDGGFYPFEKMKEGIAKVIGEVKPDVVFAPDPCVDSECHPDHLNTGNAVRNVAVIAGNEGIMRCYGAQPHAVKAIAFYMTAHPNGYIRTTGFLNQQMKAIFDCHHTQFPKENSPADTIRLYLKLRSIDFGIRSLKGTAEGFRILATIHMHCLPEAGR